MYVCIYSMYVCMYVCMYGNVTYSVSVGAFKRGQRNSSCSVLGCVIPESPSLTKTLWKYVCMYVCTYIQS